MTANRGDNDKTNYSYFLFLITFRHNRICGLDVAFKNNFLGVFPHFQKNPEIEVSWESWVGAEISFFPATAKITKVGIQLHFGWAHAHPGNCFLKILGGTYKI
jgi:hypothetical protein